MTGTQKLSEVDAIRRVISAGGAMDYIDVVEAVRQKFGMTVSMGLVEKVYRELPNEARVKVEPRLTMNLTAPKASVDSGRRTPTDADKKDAPDENSGSTSLTSHLAHALQFVKSVNGLGNAKAALKELESIMK